MKKKLSAVVVGTGDSAVVVSTGETTIEIDGWTDKEAKVWVTSTRKIPNNDNFFKPLTTNEFSLDDQEPLPKEVSPEQAIKERTRLKKEAVNSLQKI